MAPLLGMVGLGVGMPGRRLGGLPAPARRLCTAGWGSLLRLRRLAGSVGLVPAMLPVVVTWAHSVN